MTKIIFVALTFYVSPTYESKVTVEMEMPSMQECLYYKHQREMFPPPPGAFMQGFYCEERDV